MAWRPFRKLPYIHLNRVKLSQEPIHTRLKCFTGFSAYAQVLGFLFPLKSGLSWSREHASPSNQGSLSGLHLFLLTYPFAYTGHGASNRRFIPFA